MRETLLDFDSADASGDRGADAVTELSSRRLPVALVPMWPIFSFRFEGHWSKLNQIVGLRRITNISAPDICIA
jgi:hypothetical protein